MIQKMSHATIYVLDQDVAKEFYAEKLGFEVKSDNTFPNGFRWLTVIPKGQLDFEIALVKVGTSSRKVDEKDIEELTTLLGKGLLSSGAFHTADCRKTFEELKAKGVEFTQEPTDQFYGVLAVFKDPFGNVFSMTQPKNI